MSPLPKIFFMVTGALSFDWRRLPGAGPPATPCPWHEQDYSVYFFNRTL